MWYNKRTENNYKYSYDRFEFENSPIEKNMNLYYK